jgi:hypothetical protein
MFHLELWAYDGADVAWERIRSFGSVTSAEGHAKLHHPGCQYRVVRNVDGAVAATNGPISPVTTTPTPKPRPDLIPADALMSVGRVLAWGDARPGNPNRWQKLTARDHLAPALRHILSHLTGEHLDPETGEPHLAHAAARVLFALAQHLRGH